jgi:DNA invertase Pin-like site-specific DNA recombinase
MIVAIYSRKSVFTGKGESIENQIELCKEYCDRNYLGEKIEYIIYEDEGFSGGNTNRPEFQQLLKDAKAKKFNALICYRLDRISRNVADFSTTLELLQSNNIDFIPIKEQFDTSTPMGRAMVYISSVFAQLERETIQKRIKDNYYARGAKGFYMGGKIPYGFDKVEARIEGKKTSMFEVNPEQSPIVEKMYELYANTDMSLGQISKYFNEKNILSAEGKAWDNGKVSRMLRNPIYVNADADIYLYYKNKGCIISNEISDFIGTNGLYLYGKRDRNKNKYTNVENQTISLALHKGVVDSNTFLLCQYKLDSNKQIKNAGKGKHTWLSGIVKCGYCGYAVSAVANYKGQKYFNCRGKTNLNVCNGHSRPLYVEDIESMIEEEIFSKANELRNTKMKVAKENKETNEIKLKILDIDNKIENLLNALEEGNGVTVQYINERIAKLENTKNLLMEESKKIVIVNNAKKSTEEILKNIDN